MNPQHPTAISVSVADAARMTSFSQFEIRKAINEEALPYIQRGRRIAIMTDDLETWVRSMRKAGDAA